MSPFFEQTPSAPNIECELLRRRKAEGLRNKGPLLGQENHQRYEWKEVAGTDYWQYEGETLAEQRQRMEQGE